MKSYLAWPVTVKSPEGVHLQLHLTLKYLGSKLVEKDLPLLKGLLEGCNTNLDLSNASWSHATFTGATPVMVIHGLHYDATVCRRMVENLRDDDYPEWRAHITVGKSLWNEISKKGLTLRSALAFVGPLTWYVDKKPFYEWK